MKLTTKERIQMQGNRHNLGYAIAITAFLFIFAVFTGASKDAEILTGILSIWSTLGYIYFDWVLRLSD